ncbi:ferredoxin [Geodermatophilus telluris]|uniref:Ferredoxin n=1 Tax=Geodermatophilus telluris TaxID=1190417 RepID=A0A1G6VVS5_9ACTN|nr:ferredoxin [Geodermatophilus telluris]SDD56905.1 ferredoxin [Geodermatophilus telluris]
MRISIDPSLCQGHGRCYDLAPDLFGEDGEGYGTVLVPGGEVPAGEEDDARLAADNCPEAAVLVYEGTAVEQEAAR